MLSRSRMALRPRVRRAEQARAERERCGGQRRIHRAILEGAAIMLDRAVGEDRKGKHRRAGVEPPARCCRQF